MNLSRRHLVAAVVCTALPLEATEAAQDDSVLLQQLLDSGRGTLSVGRYILQRPIRAKNHVSLVIEGDIVGPGTIRFDQGCELSGEGTISLAGITVAGGTCSIEKLTFIGQAGIFAILLGGTGTNYKEVVIKNCLFQDCNYGILRQGARSSISRATIQGNKFLKLNGDAIEWNVAPNDENLLIDSNFIDGIDNLAGKPNWGIGIGLSGKAYSPEYRNEDSIKNFVVSNNIVRNARQGIHVECGKHFTIVNNKVSGISSKFSTTAGLEIAGIVVYGSSNFTIEGNTIDVHDGRSIYCVEGVGGGRKLNVCADFTIRNNKVAGGPILVSLGMDGTKTVIDGNTSDAPLELYGRAGELVVVNNKVTVAAGGIALKANFDPIVGFGTAFKASGTANVTMTNNVLKDSQGVGKIQISRVALSQLRVAGNNFDINSALMPRN